MADPLFQGKDVAVSPMKSASSPDLITKLQAIKDLLAETNRTVHSVATVLGRLVDEVGRVERNVRGIQRAMPTEQPKRRKEVNKTGTTSTYDSFINFNSNSNINFRAPKPREITLFSRKKKRVN